MTDARVRRTFVERRVLDAAGGSAKSWGIAVETPVEIDLNGAPWTVMMATPSDLEDLALGLALTERVVTDIDAVERVTIANYLDGIAVDLTVPGTALNAASQRRRSLEGRVGCGLCGVEALTGLPPRPNESVSDRVHIDAASVRRAFATLATQQPLNLATRSVHAAAWCHVDGAIDLVREDVGRHNALDKVIGALVRSGRLDEPGFVVMTSRCSFELVYKAAATRAGALATISAPTSLALEWSATLGLPLLCRGSDGEILEVDTEPGDAP
jgi:FdhD protein